MSFTGISYVAVIVAAIAAWPFGALWYGLLFPKQWMAAVGLTAPPKPSPLPFAISFVINILMAWSLAGLVAHLGPVELGRAMVTAFFVWLPFTLGPILVNHRYQSSPWALTFIDAGHWLGVLLVMALVIGLIGA